MQMIFIDIDNTLLDFDAYIRQTMREGFAHFGLKPYEPYMEAVFHRENGKLWRQIEQGTLTFRELEEIRWNNVFRALNIDFDGPAAPPAGTGGHEAVFRLVLRVGETGCVQAGPGLF